MGFQIEDGIGTGNRVEVTNENQLSTVSVNHELQHHISVRDGLVFQAIGEHTLTGAGTKTLLHLTNKDPEYNLTISYMRLQYPGGDGTIDAASYFQCGYGTTYASGGTVVAPVNMNTNSGNEAVVEVYDDNPTVSGTLTEFDRWYCDKGMMTFNKHGSIILGLDDSLEWRLITDQTTGLAYVRITFAMIKK